jgi:hypothetical protein
MESMLNKDSFYSKSFVIFIRHPEMLKLDGTPCTTVDTDDFRRILSIDLDSNWIPKLSISKRR